VSAASWWPGFRNTGRVPVRGAQSGEVWGSRWGSGLAATEPTRRRALPRTEAAGPARGGNLARMHHKPGEAPERAHGGATAQGPGASPSPAGEQCPQKRASNPPLLGGNPDRGWGGGGGLEGWGGGGGVATAWVIAGAWAHELFDEPGLPPPPVRPLDDHPTGPTSDARPLPRRPVSMASSTLRLTSGRARRSRVGGGDPTRRPKPRDVPDPVRPGPRGFPLTSGDRRAFRAGRA